MRERGSTISLRIRPALKARLEAAAAAHPYRPSLTAILERGAELALAEMALHAPTPQPITDGPIGGLAPGAAANMD